MLWMSRLKLGTCDRCDSGAHPRLVGSTSRHKRHGRLYLLKLLDVGNLGVVNLIYIL